ncbi:MAG: PEP-CTERM sorting domain-containing protein [Rhodanobacteraceae bacterium]|nr:MAG: PEP-CTERM sorting domain-containing protein [Rhodanobacteraceae bacterium]
MKKISLFSMFAAALALGALAPAAQATAISTTIQLSQLYAGSAPDGGSPWLKAMFTSSTGSTTGTLTLKSNLKQSDFVKGQDGPNTATGWSFYLNETLASWSCATGGACASGVSTAPISKAGPVHSPFNLTFGWTSGNRFDGTDSATYTLTFGSALTGDPFAANGSGWWSVAHVQGIGPSANCSGWIVSGNGTLPTTGFETCGEPPTNVPEPTNLGMFGIGLLAIGLFLGLRRRVV